MFILLVIEFTSEKMYLNKKDWVCAKEEIRSTVRLQPTGKVNIPIPEQQRVCVQWNRV